ncbi:MAG: uroporphyrinogen decarboxylase [Phycisphaerae bacterium]|nr:uroporphyrinogen decarboxylase [Phycisphaerae bacterium]
MTHEQWERLLGVLNGDVCDPLPVGFIIDSPWLPTWAGLSILDYYTNERMWLEANMAAIRRFSDVLFLPGFWSEYGMCTEPSAFGARCIWYENEFPFAEPILCACDAISSLRKPDPRKDGLAPFVLKRLEHCRADIEGAGHAIRFAVARGPLNVATFLMGNTEFLVAMKTSPDETHVLLRTITDYLVDWVRLQVETFPTIEGVLLLDDILGFIGEEDFVEFAKGYLKDVFGAVDAKVRFLHNDAHGLICAKHLVDIGVNLFNFGFEHGLAEMKALTGGAVALLGNIPPRDVLAQGTPDEVRDAVRASIESVEDKSRIILSCGGGMPPGVSTENVEAFLGAAGYSV